MIIRMYTMIVKPSHLFCGRFVGKETNYNDLHPSVSLTQPKSYPTAAIEMLTI